MMPEMLVQDRVFLDSGSKTPTYPRAAPGSDRRHPRPLAKSHDFSNWASENSSRLLLILFVVASVGAVFLLRGAGPDAAALLCVDPSSAPTTLPYPDVAWSKIRPLAIVVSVSSPATAALAALTRVKVWQLLAVGNSHTPATSSPSNTATRSSGRGGNCFFVFFSGLCVQMFLGDCNFFYCSVIWMARRCIRASLFFIRKNCSAGEPSTLRRQ
jgi:hypothetical protein